MTTLETTYPCPVCLGVFMRKVRPGAANALVLDHCMRCGGTWFNQGEVQLLRQLSPQELWSVVTRRDEAVAARCHSCHAHYGREAEACPACGERIVLQCPECDRPMETESHEGIRLDLCRNCRGVWFDHAELEAIWTQRFEAAMLAKRQKTSVGDVDDAASLFYMLAYMPDVTFAGAYLAGSALQGAGELASRAPDVLAAAGDAAGSVFEVIVEIIGGIFS